MKTILKALSVFLLAASASATPFYFYSLYSDGTPNTNRILMSAWPSARNITAYGTNIVYGGAVTTLTPDTNGYVTNWVLPNLYRFQITNVGVAFLADIPDTTTNNSLALYVTNIARYTGDLTSNYQLVTNWLTFAPATNSNAGIVSALAYTPATNSNPGIVAALGYTPATNNNAGIVAALGFTPQTNTFAGVTNSLGYLPATNSNAGIVAALAYTPATNSFDGVVSALTYTPATNSNAGIVAALGYTPPANTYAAVTNALGYLPATNNWETNILICVTNVTFETNGSGYVTNLTLSLFTNVIFYHQK